MESLKIILVSPEVAPYAKTGGLADVAGSLPSALKALGSDVSVFMPHYSEVKRKGFETKHVKKNIKIEFGDSHISFNLNTLEKNKVSFYFIEKDEYYDRDFLYGTPAGDYSDNALRFAFFAKAVLQSIMALNYKPDIIHCNDWQTALMPFYLRFASPYADYFRDTRTLFTMHNLAYQGLFPKEIMPIIGIGHEFFTFDKLEFYEKLSFMKSGILYSDAVSTVSRGYAREILTPEYGCGLDGLLGVRRNDLYGIVNGADYSEWNPETDKFIKANFSKKNPEDKTKCKKDLLTQMKLKVQIDKPLLGVVTRLADQKGMDIITNSVDNIIELGCGLVILGAGEEKYHVLLKELSKKYPKNIAVKIAFDNPLAHKIEAGCDMFLMPSRYEPCGLNQMYSLKYGTIPVVRATGGLDDTIIDYTHDKKNGNGFKFNQASKEDFIDALTRAVSVYENKREWKKLVERGMDEDFSWNYSAKEYIKVYRNMREKTSDSFAHSNI